MSCPGNLVYSPTSGQCHCPTNLPYLNSTTQTCFSCPVNQTYSEAQGKCVCSIPGTYLINGQCIACPVGTQYAPHRNQCIRCITGTVYDPTTEQCVADPVYVDLVTIGHRHRSFRHK